MTYKAKLLRTPKDNFSRSVVSLPQIIMINNDDGDDDNNNTNNSNFGFREFCHSNSFILHLS